jgi:hypothetical protein
VYPFDARESILSADQHRHHITRTFFKTYEGRDIIYILDEGGFIEDIVYKNGNDLRLDSALNLRYHDAFKLKAKREAQRAARKKNRRHR